MTNVNSDIAYDYIRKKILSGEFALGQALMTMNLASEIGVSRTPVRDALRQLEADGLVVIRPRLGASVKSLDLKEYRETCGLRLALETYAAGLAASHRTEEDLHEMRYALEAMARLEAQLKAAEDAESKLIPDLVREDIRFHIAIMTAARNDLLKKEILRLHLINRVVGLGPIRNDDDRKARNERRRDVLVSHKEIFDAIQRRDVASAKTAMEHHIQDIIDYQLRNLARSGSRSGGKELTEDELAYTA